MSPATRPRRAATGEPITRRALNRATLARQLLLERSTLDVADAVSQVGGLNAQVPNPPYLALWSRLAGFERADLARLVDDRTLVRMPLARATQRLVTTDDALWLRPALAPMLAQAHRSTFGRQVVGLDLDELVEEASAALEEGPLTGSELRSVLVERFPAYDRSALAYSAHHLLALVALPSASVWDSRKRLTHALLEQWAGRPLDPGPGLPGLVLHHLAAYGPASVTDVRAWSRASGLAPVVDELRPTLRIFVDEDGRELLDLPDAPRPDPDTPAPVRLLPEFDELLMAHHDRRRVVSDEHRTIVCVPDLVRPTVLVDGLVAATWTLERSGEQSLVTVQPLRRLGRRERAEVSAEAGRLATWAAPRGAVPDVRVLEV